MIGRLLIYGVGEKMTRRLAAVVIGSQALVVFFGTLVAYARGNATDDPNAGRYLWLGSLLAIACIFAAGLLRRPWGVTLGWLIEIATLASGFVVPAMFFVGALFFGLWVTALFQGDKMDELTRNYLAGDLPAN